jgi:hypothetical protein
MKTLGRPLSGALRALAAAEACFAVLEGPKYRPIMATARTSASNAPHGTMTMPQMKLRARGFLEATP